MVKSREEYYRTLLEISPDAISLTDMAGNILICNQHMACMLGLDSAEQVSGHSSFAFIVPEDRLRARENTRRITETGGLRNIEYSMLHRDGSRFPVEVNASLLAEQKDHPSVLINIVRDVSERRKVETSLRESEARMLAILDTAVDAIITIEETGTIQTFNRSAERLFGYSADEVIGVNVKILMPQPFHNAHDQYIESYLKTGVKKIIGIGREVTGIHKDGSLFPLELSVNEVHLGQRRLFTAFLHDITDRKQAETALRLKNEELAMMTQQLWQAAKLATMGELAASVAHELNNPLAIISVRTEFLLEQFSADERDRSQLEVIERQVEHMAALVANLLQFSRRSPQQISTIDIREEIQKTLDLMSHHLRSRQIAIQREFPPAIPLLPADRQQMRQLFLNLFTNASDAMPAGGVLTIRVEEEDGWIAVWVCDNGIGIPTQDLPKIMDPFFTTKPDERGTGLGLAICQRILQEHGGAIEIFSKGMSGEGTQVHLTLPTRAKKKGRNSMEP